MIALGHILQIVYVGILGAIALGISIHHRPDDPVAADCPFCRGDGCERCGWSGEVADAELASVRDGSCDDEDDDEVVPEDPDRARDWAIADEMGVW